jgi:hypothetical protein
MWIFIALVVAIIAYIVANKLIIKCFQNVYTKTGVHPFSIPHQIFSALIFTPILLNIANEWIETYVFVIIGAIAVAVLVLLNLKLKDVKTIIACTLLQVVFGVFFLIRAFLSLLIIIWNVVGGMTGLPHISYNPMKVVVVKNGRLQEESTGDMPTVDEPNNAGAFMGFDVEADSQRRREEAEGYAEAEKQRANERAEAYARSQGFSSAAEAEENGFKTGKPNN